MTCPDCDRQIHTDRCACGWKVPKTATDTWKAVNTLIPSITKEQFGVDLYECIKKFSERQWLRDEQRRTADSLRFTPLEKRLKIDSLKKREAEVTKALLPLTEKIQPADMKRLLDKYETPIAV